MDTSIVNSSNKENLTPFVFYDYLLPEIRKTMLEHPQKKICLDISQVKKINPLVLPNLLIVGKILKSFYNNNPVHLIISRENLQVIKFLECMSFFSLVDKLELFTYEKGLVGDFNMEDFGEIVILYHMQRARTTPNEIAQTLLNSNQQIGRFIRSFEDSSLGSAFLYSLSEIIHNCMKHGKSSAFIAIYSGPRLGLNCAVSDSGIGYLESLSTSKEDAVVFTNEEMLNDTEHSVFKAIIEATFKRFHKKTYGLASVVKAISELGGTTRVHSLNTQVVFTPQNYSEVDVNDIATTGQRLANKLIETSTFSTSDQSKPLRIRASKLPGVHIEFQIPTASGSERGGKE